MRSNIAWIGLSLFTLLGAGIFTACGKITNSEVGSAYPVAGQDCDDPGEKATAADGCNECTCTTDGKWSCTDAACTSGSGGSGGGVAGSGGGGGVQGCTAGDEKKVECNTCTCQPDGTWACTDMACDLPLPVRCNPGTARKEDCNYCTCNAEGVWACGKMDCGQLPGECTPGEATKADCNECLCDSDRTWACKDLGCNPPPPPPCKNGETKNQRCNTCTCMNGDWGCTQKACAPQCNPGDAASSLGGCNVCKCDAEGFWDCMLNACQEPPEACPDSGEQVVGCLVCRCDGGKYYCDPSKCTEF